jgi:ABC-type sugar transport system substrate-binding protein
MEGFFQQSRAYGWRVVEAFTTMMNIEEAKHSIREIIQRNPEIAGLFLTYEHASLAYLEMVHAEEWPWRSIAVVCYDINADIVNAIENGEIVGTIFQNPSQIGKTAAHKLLEIFRDPSLINPPSPQETMTPVMKVTKQEVASFWPPPKF